MTRPRSSRVAAAVFQSPALELVRVILRKIYRRANFPVLDRRGGCALKKKAAFLIGADGVVDQARKQKERCASINLSTTPPLAMKNNRSRLPLLSRTGKSGGRHILLSITRIDPGAGF
jgi:hypothetical protein